MVAFCWNCDRASRADGTGSRLYGSEPTPLIRDRVYRSPRVEFADRRKATNVDFPWFAHRPDERKEPEGPVLIEHGGGGSDTRFEQGFWVWPLPPPGPLAFVCEWPSQSVPLTRVEIDASRIAEASKRAEVLWESTARGAAGARTATRFYGSGHLVGGELGEDAGADETDPRPS
jgi:hypothetical protein